MADIPLLVDSPQLVSFNICRGSPNVKFLELQEKLFNPSPRNIVVRLADSPQKLFNYSPRNIAVRLVDSPQKLFNPLSPAKAPRLFKLATSYLETAPGTPHEIGYFMRGWDTNGNFVYWSSTAAPNLSPVTTIPTLVGSLTNICLIGTTTT